MFNKTMIAAVTALMLGTAGTTFAAPTYEAGIRHPAPKHKVTKKAKAHKHAAQKVKVKRVSKTHHSVEDSRDSTASTTRAQRMEQARLSWERNRRM